ncbi:MAG TPA: signal peptide peptidase SppA [Coriobacteriia bacterium]
MSDAPLETPATVAVPPRKSRKWIWVTLIVVALMLLIAGCCGWTTWLAIKGGGDAGTGGGFGDAVAVIYIDGTISGVDSGGTFTSGGNVTPERVLKELKEAEDDEAVKAIILRIDSPGGTASASSEIAMEVARVKKPIIASVGDVCASGSYMIASQCDEIISTGSSDIGSIGVIMEVTDASALLDKMGVKFVSIHEGEFKDAGAPWRSLTATETAMLESDIKLVYDDFIAVVAKGRKMGEPEVRKLATGWAWPGVRAKELGLVDRLGNYSDAIARAGRLGGIEGEPRVVKYRDESLSTLLSGLTSSIDRLGRLGSVAPDLLEGRPTLK